MGTNFVKISAVIVSSLLLLGAAIAVAQLQPVARAQEEAVVEQAAVVTVTAPLLQYQGRLTDPATGAPVADGSYTMVLRLYREPQGGTPLWSEAKDVTVVGGLFSTVLGDTTTLDHALFNGQALWLGVKVGADAEATPRQQVLPVAYALSLVPGATIQAGGGATALTVGSTGSGKALRADGPVVVNGNLAVNGTLSGQHANDAAAHHTRYTNNEAITAVLSHPEIVTEYEFADHVYGGMHHTHAVLPIASGSINDDGTTASASSNVSSRWDPLWECYEITIDGIYYEWRSYATVVTPVAGGGIANVWDLNGKMCVGIYTVAGEVQKLPFQFATFAPQ